MTNAKTTSKKSDAKTVATVETKILTVADVARKLNLEPKSARAYLRKNAEQYTMRGMRFAEGSKQFKDCVAALTKLASKHVVHTA